MDGWKTSRLPFQIPIFSGAMLLVPRRVSYRPLRECRIMPTQSRQNTQKVGLLSELKIAVGDVNI